MGGQEWQWLTAAAAIAVIHVAIGPDHTLPFVVMARARGWKPVRALSITALCGIGHVTSSLLLVGAGLGLAHAVGRLAGAPSILRALDGYRGGIATWGMVAFGTAYALWGARRAIRSGSGIALHEHRRHVHIHRHGSRPHRHPHHDDSRTTFWTLFVLLVLGPCEPLLALFLPPALTGQWGLMLQIGLVFGVCTLATMLVLVGLAYAGLRRLPLGRFERWSHAMAGGVIAVSGLAVLLFGL